MKHGSLFSGIGGFDLASQWMGWENVFHCEIESFPRKILHHYWPNAISYEDIKKTDFTIHKGRIDIITGGFPCQPYSMAGKRKGKEDERHLWPEMLRAIREIQPRWVVGENVFGLINWNGGLVFDEVQSDLETEGYEVQAYVLPAAAVNAPHRRDRVWFVAYSSKRRWRKRNKSKYNKFEKWAVYKDKQKDRDKIWSNFRNGSINGPIAYPPSNGCNDESSTKNNTIGADNQQSGTQRLSSIKRFGNESDATNTDNNGQNKCDSQHEINTSQGGINALGNIEQVGEYAPNTDSTNNKTRTQREVLGQSDRQKTNGYSNVECRNQWQNFPTQSPICGGNDGIPDRLDNITFPKWRNESIKGYGNAIVPQVVYQIFKAIEEYESL